MGTPELPGIRKRIYYISKDQIAEWPTYIRDITNRRMKKAAYSGDFVLVADAKWKYIDVLPEKSQLTSEPQGGTAITDAVEQAGGCVPWCES